MCKYKFTLFNDLWSILDQIPEIIFVSKII